MATASPEIPQTNLFGGSSSGVMSPPETTNFPSSSSSKNNKNKDTAKSQWFEEDDELLLSTLLTGNDGDNDENTTTTTNLDQRLSRMHLRFQQDLSRRATTTTTTSDRWWNYITDTAISSGFQCAAVVSNSSSSSIAGGNKEEDELLLPKSFHTMEGQQHLQALVDLLGISKERAVKITLATLRSFASLNSSPSSGGEESDKENTNDKEEDSGGKTDSRDSEDLRSLLGTKDLFSLVLNRNRRQFIARLRVITECLRLEQEYKSSDEKDDDDDDDDDEGIGKACSSLLDKIDASLVVNGNKRGLFQLLLGLATGPSLPGLGDGRELPYSVGKLTGGVGGSTNESSSLAIGTEESNLAIRNEAAEALLMLLYDRIDNGVQRVDLFLLMEAARCCPEFEFGMNALDYSKSGNLVGGGRGGIMSMRSDGQESGVAAMEKMQVRLNGIWSLLCSECMGLWRANNTSNGDWVKQHPFFVGLDDETGRGALSLRLGASDGSSKTRIELEALCQKIREVGETVRDRRRFAYESQMRLNQHAVADDGDELWGIQAPDAVTLLSFGLLLRLAHISSPSDEFLAQLGGWGQECAQMANDECAAFAYLHSVMENIVLDPFGKNGRRRRDVGNEKMVDCLIKRGELQMTSSGVLALMDGEQQGNDVDEESLEGFTGDAASIVYQSIGNEILAGTIRSFREALLSLQSPSAVDNICMLTNLASVLYRNSSILCDQFWCDWENFCQGDGMADADSSDDPMCYLLDASHNLAVSTLVELNKGGSENSIIHFLKPLSSFLHFIASMCANSATVHSILDSEFLPDGLIANSMSVCAALAPLISSLNASDNHITSEERSTVRHATTVIQSISTLAYFGGKRARDWIRQSLGPKVLCDIASRVVPQRQNIMVHDCIELASSAMNLLAELLSDSDAAFQSSALICFSSSVSFGADSSSAFNVLASGGVHSEATLSVMLVMNCLAVNLTRNTFHAQSNTQGIVSSLMTVGNGIKVGLEVLLTLFSGGEVSFPSSDLQVGICHSIVSSVVATLIGLKPIIYLHEDDSVRDIAVAIRDEIINALATSAALGQVVASLASAPISLALMKNATTLQELSVVMDSAVYQRENVRDSGKYGSWSRFVTPKRAKQKRATKSAEISSNADDSADASSNINDLAVISLSLLLLWGENAEDITRKLESSDESLLALSPCNLLLCKACLPVSKSTDSSCNIANLNLISRYPSVDNIVAGGAKSKSALLSAKIVKMCLEHASTSSGVYGDTRIGLSVFRAALGGGMMIFNTLFDTFDRLQNDSYLDGNDDSVLMAVTLLETVAISVTSHPELARSMLVGTEVSQNWKLIDLIVASVNDTVELVGKSADEDESVNEEKISLRSFLTCGCLHMISALWKSCRLVCTQNARSESKHACGVVTSHLAGANDDSPTTLIANTAAELTRCTLLAIMSLQESENDDAISYKAINKKCILVDMLTKALDIIAIEAVTRIQTKIHGGISFVEDLFEPGPMECWSILLASNNAAGLAASSWLFGFSASVEKSNALNWNVGSFLEAYPAEKNLATSTWCLYGQSTRLADALTCADSDSSRKFLECNTLYSSIQAEDCLAASWAHFFEVVAAGCIKSKGSKEVQSLMNSLAECSLASLSSISESKTISESILSSQGLSESPDTMPIGDLCSLLLYSLSVSSAFDDFENVEDRCDVLLGMFGRLYESANRLFAMTQLGSASSSNQVAVCSIRQRLLSSALVIVSEFEKLSDKRTRESSIKYNEIRIGLTNLAVNALQSLQYVQGGSADTEASDDTFAPSKFSYDFASKGENGDSAFQLLRTSISLLSQLSPTSNGHSNYQSHSYGVDFSSCFKQRNALQQLQYHLSSASSVTSLTYQAVHGGTASQSVTTIHSNAVDIVNFIMTLMQTLTDSGSSTVSTLLLLAESGCFRALIGNQLLKATSVAWAPKSGSVGESASPIVTRHRGYNAPIQTNLSGARPASQKDSVHEIWLVAVNTFASLLRSVRQQSSTHEKVDEQIVSQLAPISKIVFDFVCSYERELFSCFAALFNEVHAQGNLSNKGGKSSFSSSIQSSSFAFTSNLLKECEAVSFLFAELCTGNTRTQFARSCGSIYKKILTASVELTKMTSSFLGSIGNARELFMALSDAKTMLDQPSAMLDAHPLLVEGIPNARHEAIRNAHFAHSCCILATREDFRDAHTATTKDARVGESESTQNSSASLEQSFQIHVNNKFIAEVEEVAGYCLFNSLSVVANAHPASESFVSLSPEEASQLDVASVINPGAVVAICPQNTTAQSLKRYRIQAPQSASYARTIRCDRSTRAITVKYIKSGEIEHVPWSWLVGMEDTSKKHSLFSYLPAAKSIADADVRGQPSLGHLVLALKWCRHYSSSSSSLNDKNTTPMYLVNSVAERASILLCTEVLLHDELRDSHSRRDETTRKINMQLLDLFGSDFDSSSLSAVMNEDILESIKMQLKDQLHEASLEREEERKMWEEQTNWDNASFLGGKKREGRRSPFRSLSRKTSSDFS